MPTAKGKGGPASHRYRPASEYDDATLAQKREYWRTKKREQRARLSEQREKPLQDSPGKRILHQNSPVSTKSSSPSSFAAFSSLSQKDNESHKTASVSLASQSRTKTRESSVEATESQKEKWLQSMSLNKVLPQFPASCLIPAKAAGAGAAKVKCVTARGAANRAITSPTSSGTQLNTSSSVPPARLTTITNGSSTKTTPQPCVSMQGASVPKSQHKQAQVASCVHPKLSPTNVTTGLILVSPQSLPSSVKTEDTTPQGEIKSALVSLPRTRGDGNSQPSLESEEERAAKRREQWRIKKREQRAKVAARIAKARERTQDVEMMVQRQRAQKNGLVGGTVLQRLPSRQLVKRAGQKLCPTRAKAVFTSIKREKDELESGSTSLAAVNFEADRIEKVQNLHENRTQTTITPDTFSVKKPGEAQRKLPVHVHLSNVTRGIARFKTHRQRSIEAHKNFIIQRNIRCKSSLLASVFGSRNIPKIDPNDTPEQIIAKRREYWRIKKREQRAKLSMEMKTRLKEKDSLMRRVKRYQNILEEMRRARAQVQSSGSSLTHASETIGGFIKEDGTVTVNIPQVPAEFSTAANKSEKELRVVSQNTPITKPEHQPDTKRRGNTSIRVNPPSAVLHPPQVKVSVPLSINKSPRPLSIRPTTQIVSTGIQARQTVTQLTLSHPPTHRNAVSGGSAVGSDFGGCVMKMTVSSTTPLLSTSSLDQGLTEEERMAKKREYWRIKKREQRAARAARLKLGLLQGRAMAVLQRRKTQKQIRPVPLSRRLTNHTGNAQPLPDNNVPVLPHTSKIKHESEFTPAVDLNSQPEQAICPDIKPPTSPTPPPAPQLEPDPALNVDNQATTLLAVASMKKLLEESLSTVTECKGEETSIKIESSDEVSEPQTKPDLSQLLFEKDEVSPIAAADLTLEIKSFQPDTDALVQAPSPSPHLKDSPRINETPSPLSTSDDVVLHPTCEHSSQTDSSFIVNPSVEASDVPYSTRRTQRLCTKKPDHQNSFVQEPPKLHHLPVDQLQPHFEPQEQLQNNNTPSPKKYSGAVTEHSGLSSLQRKREYWKLMKRQQRARSKARQRERQGECSSRLSQRNIQAPGLVIINSVKRVNPPAKTALQPKPQVTNVPKVLTVTPDTLQIKLPLNTVPASSRNETNNTNGRLSWTEPDRVGALEDQKEATIRPAPSGSRDLDSTPFLPTLKPPDNPLSSINLQPFEPPGQSPNPTLSPIKIPCTRLQSPSHVTPPKLNLPVSTMVPPKPIPGESEEDFLKRKREYWRIKKKEQRARKAFSDKGTSQRRAANNWRPIQPAQDLPPQDSGQWGSSSEEPDHLMSSPVNTNQETFEYPSYTAPVEDESELLFPDYENNHGEDGTVPDTVWRNRYLMDYDPLNQLLVCMVCGELQYSHSLEGVRAHIDEAHPDTLTLEPGEQQRILEAWDEQVSRRERFFTSQLQQHSGVLAEAQKN